MISIITVHFNTYDFLGLLIESLHLFSQVPYELIVIDNSDNRQQLNHPNVHQIFMPSNIGHGRGLNVGVTKAHELFPDNPFIMFLDSDCHILKYRWEMPFISKMKEFDIIAGKGPPSKPVRPACMFMRRELSRFDWEETEGYRGNRATPGGYDVACKAYFKIMAANFRIGFLTAAQNRYGTANGEEWCIDDNPLVYHHWHGSWLNKRQEETPEIDLMADKTTLFSKIPWHLP